MSGRLTKYRQYSNSLHVLSFLPKSDVYICGLPTNFQKNLLFLPTCLLLPPTLQTHCYVILDILLMTSKHARLSIIYVYHVPPTCFGVFHTIIRERLCFSYSKLCAFYTAMIYLPTNSGRRYKNPITDQDRPWGLQKIKAPIFQDSRHMKVVRLSALRTGRFYPPGNNLGNHFC